MKKVLILLSVLIALAGCSARDQATLNGQFVTARMDNLPADACTVGGIPQIYGVSYIYGGGYLLVYLRNNGDVVSLSYDPAATQPGHYWKSAEVYWTGGNCPSADK